MLSRNYSYHGYFFVVLFSVSHHLHIYRLPLFEERREKIQIVYDYFMQEDSLKNFVPTLGVRKGRKLLARLMPLLDKVIYSLVYFLKICLHTGILKCHFIHLPHSFAIVLWVFFFVFLVCYVCFEYSVILYF